MLRNALPFSYSALLHANQSVPSVGIKTADEQLIMRLVVVIHRSVVSGLCSTNFGQSFDLVVECQRLQGIGVNRH